MGKRRLIVDMILLNLSVMFRTCRGSAWAGLPPSYPPRLAHAICLMVAGARYELQAWAWVEWPHRTRFAEDWLTKALLDTLVAFFPQMLLVSFDSWLLTCFFFNFNSFQLFCRLELSSYPALRDAKRRPPWFLFKERTCGVAWGDHAQLLDTALLFGGFFILASNCQENMTQGMPRDPSFSGLGRQLIAAEDSATHSLCRTTMGPGRAVTQPCGSHSSEPLMYQGWALMKLHFQLLLGGSPNVSWYIIPYTIIYTIYMYILTLISCIYLSYIRLAALHPSLKHDVKTVLMSLCLTHSHVSRSKLAMFHGFCRPF